MLTLNNTYLFYSPNYSRFVFLKTYLLIQSCFKRKSNSCKPLERLVIRMAYDVFCGGILVADHICDPISHLPLEGELVATNSMGMSLGGCAANVAVCLRKLNVFPRISGRVGKDHFGTMISEMLREQQIPSEGIETDAHETTSQTMVVNVKGQDRRFIHCIGANKTFSDINLNWEHIKDCKILYLGGYLLMKKLSPNHVANVFSKAQKQGITTILDVVTPGREDFMPSLAPVLPFTDIFMPNDTEAQLITGKTGSLEQALFFQHSGVKTTIITKGSKGTLMATPGGTWVADIFSMDYVDGSGSGDAFAAGFMKGILNNRSQTECLVMGSAMGASVVRATGTTKSAFTEKELENYVQQNKLSIQKIA